MRRAAPRRRQSVKRRPVSRITTAAGAGPSGGDGAASRHQPAALARDLHANRPTPRVWSIAAAVNHDAFKVDLDASPWGMRHAQSSIRPAGTARLTHMSHAQGRSLSFARQDPARLWRNEPTKAGRAGRRPRAGIRASRRAYRCANSSYNPRVRIFKPMTTIHDPGRP